MENKTAENTYLIDLSYTKTPADVVFELSSVIENEAACNKKVILNLGDVDLNQSQLLSIKSLINGINSSLVTLSTKSNQTQQAAMALGIVLDNNEPRPEAAQYVPMTEHIEQTVLETETTADIPEEQEEIPTDNASLIESDSENEEKTEDIEEKEIEEELNKPIIEESKEEEIKSGLDTLYEGSDGDVEPVKLGSIFDSEQKLEKLFEEQESKQDEIPPDGISVKIEIPTVRSGQVVNYDGNVVIIGDCHPGSEIIASGDITVWGVLGGIAHAGAKGNKKARIRALNLNAIQLRIAQYYARRPDSINIMYAEKTNTFTPEEARILNDNIVILRLNDK